MFKTLCRGIFFLSICGFSLSASAEVLNYQLSYQGMLSLGKRLPIADLQWHYRVLDDENENAGRIDETQLQLSSHAYAHVEKLYPLRYRFRSWRAAGSTRVLASEYFEQNNHNPPKHQLIHLDHPSLPFETHELSPQGLRSLPALEAGTYGYAEEVVTEAVAGFDRLGMLQGLRTEVLSLGQTTRYAVTNGRGMLEYRVTPQKQQSITVSGVQYPAWKIRFDAITVDKKGRERHAHRPLYVWLSDDDQRIPLRAEGRHKLGVFILELHPQPTPLVMAVSDVGQEDVLEFYD